MSDNSKMGLFGSKDKESKDNSPHSYAPYCVDSDSETYDTEALSIMDINDIIGIQSEPVSESTLESEIAALSKIITDSKGEFGQKEMNVSNQLHADDMNASEEFVLNEEAEQDSVKIGESSYKMESDFSGISNLSTGRVQQEAINSELLSSICNEEIDECTSLLQECGSVMRETKLDGGSNSNQRAGILLDYPSTSEDTLLKDETVQNKSSDIATGIEDKQELMKQIICSTSAISANPERVGNNMEIKGLDVVSTEESRDCDSVVANVSSNNPRATNTLTVGSINTSLQLIGEAYTSEDSQEMESNDEFSDKVKSNTVPIIANYNVDVKSDFIDNVQSEAAAGTTSDFIKNSGNKSNDCIASMTLQSQEKNVSEQCLDVDEIEDCELHKDESNLVCDSQSQINDSTVTEDSKDILLEKFRVNEDIEKIDCEMKEIKNLSQLSEPVNDDTEQNVEMDRTDITEENILTELKESESENKDEEKHLLSLDSKEDIQELEAPTVSQTQSSTEVTSVKNGTLQSDDKNQESLNEASTETIEMASSLESKDHTFEQEDQCIAKIEANITLQESENTSLEVCKNDEKSCKTPEDTEPLSTRLESVRHTLDSKTDNLLGISNTSEPLLEIEQKNIELVKEICSKREEPSKLNDFQLTKEDHLENLQSFDHSLQAQERQQDLQNTQLLPCSMDVEPSLASGKNIVNDVEMCENLENNDIEMSDIKNNFPLISESSESKVVESDKSNEVKFESSAIDPLNITSNVALKNEDESVSIKSDLTFKKETSPVDDDLKNNDNTESEFVKLDDYMLEKDINSSDDTSDQKTLTENSEISNVPCADPETTNISESEPVQLESDVKTTEIALLVSEELNISEDCSTTVEQSDSEIIEKDKCIDEVGKVSDIVDQTKNNLQLLDNKENDVSKVNSEDTSSSNDVTYEDKNLKNMLPSQSEHDTNKESLDTEEIVPKVQSKIKHDDVKSESHAVENAQINVSQSDNNDNVHSDILQIIREERSNARSELESIEAEEAMEEEMKLTLDPDDADMQLEEMQSDVKKVLNEETVENVEEEMEDQVEMDLSLDPDEKMDDLQADIDESKGDLLIPNAECPTEVATTSSNGKIEILVNKELEGNEDDLKNILCPDEGIVEIFNDDRPKGTQDIMPDILDTVDNVAEILTNVQPREMVEDLKDILETEESVQKEIEEVLLRSTDLPLVETEIEDLAEKLPQESNDILNKELEDPMTGQNIDSLEGLLDLDLIPEGEESALKAVETTGTSVTKGSEEEIQSMEKEMDVTLLLEDSSQTMGLSQDTDYITDVISSCLTNTDSSMLEDSTANANVVEIVMDKPASDKTKELLVINENLVDESINKNESTVEEQNQLESEENDLDMPFELTEANEPDNPLETMTDLESESKVELSEDLLLEGTDQSNVLNDAAAAVEASEPNSEISELESAVKFLQESEEQAMDSPLVLSPKMVDNVVDGMPEETETGLFIPEEDSCESSSELIADLQNISSDPIAISEAEIISEAAKLESERRVKLTEQGKSMTNSLNFTDVSTKLSKADELLESNTAAQTAHVKKSELQRKLREATTSKQEGLDNLPKLSENILTISEPIPKMSILEERLKEPPKIEIPTLEMSKSCDTSTATKTSLLIQKDAKPTAYQKMLESPKGMEKTELKFVETPRKDSDKHDFENVGSPRIILKIAKSAIADCGEPRSPKSPKLRSTTSSPNPEDSPGQKLGKIKLKLSKGGHPSIISNENVEEMGQWHTEGTSSPSPIGMKIKLSKSGDASIIQTEKYEVLEDSKESRHRFEEVKRIESPIGMKIKLSKSGDASIVQQDSREITSKYKDKSDTVQEAPKRTESPIGMKIKLSKTGDASIIQPEKQDNIEDYKDVSFKHKEKIEITQETLKRTESPIGMKIKLSKTGDASIVPSDLSEDAKESVSRSREKLEYSQEAPKRTESPIGVKIKLSKTKGASIIQPETSEDGKDKLEIPEIPKRTESPLGMKIKLSKTGDASIIHTEISDESKDVAAKHREKLEAIQDAKQTESAVGVKIRVTKPKEASMVSSDVSEDSEITYETSKKCESSIGMKFKLSKSGDASIIYSERQEPMEESKIKERVDSFQEISKRTESPIGMKIKLSKTGDASIIQPEISEEIKESTSKSIEHSEAERPKRIDSPLGVKIKLLKTGDASIVEPEKKEKTQKRKDIESPLEMKIRLSKTGHPTIITSDNHGELTPRNKDITENLQGLSQKQVDPSKEPALKILKTGHSTIVQSNRSELTIEPIQSQSRKIESGIELTPKRKDITISPIELKKAKLEAKLSHILPEVTIQPVMLRNQKQMMFDPKTSAISRQQMNVISQEISITQVRPSKSTDLSMSEKLKDILSKNVPNSPSNSDCEIIEHRPELIIVNENSNSSQDIMIIEEVPSVRMPEVKIPKKRGRPRRNPLPAHLVQPPTPHMLLPRDPLALDDGPQVVRIEQRENERPKRTCRNQKSYAPPKRGRRRGRGKRKMAESKLDSPLLKKSRIDEDLTAIEQSTMGLITLDSPMMQQDGSKGSSELYKALKQPPMDRKGVHISRSDKQSMAGVHKELERKIDAFKGSLPNSRINAHLEAMVGGPRVQIQLEPIIVTPKIQIVHQVPRAMRELLNSKSDKSSLQLLSEETHKTEILGTDKRGISKLVEDAKSGVTIDGKDVLIAPGHQNWLTPSSKKQSESSNRSESISTVQVIDEETRMSAESGSRSQTPARNVSAPASETIINEESQGSVLSTATTESEKVKVKNRRMEINFDPDEGPFTVDKIAEYEWPLDRKGETFMVQEQISQYLGVKSFKRKYPDLKRRMVDMEERNYLRENGLVSEGMCDMGLTAICSTEVLDVMCSDFPDQYEEYRKHMREKQVKEHSKKQKELTAAANAERNRIDLAEMAVQSALSWNVSLNKARKETRKCSLDLQTFTIHVPKKQQKVETERKISHYPVALIPGQYTDYYREYTPAELRYYPLNTVLYGPMRPNERKFDSQSEGSQSDSDSDSSTDDSSSSSSEGTQDTEESQSTMDEVDMEIAHQKDESKHVKCKMCLKNLNKNSKNEVLIQCGTCNGNVHPSCIDLTLDMVPHIQAYSWQCTDCKTCAQCHDPADEDKMLFCDMCDRGYHIYCVGLRRVPQGRWHCQECAVCANCGSREPGGATSDRNSVAQWQHEYKKGEKNTRVYVSTLCVPCSKLWRKGRYCPHCSRCHSAPRLDLEVNLVHCSACDKYLHLGCVETKGAVIDKRNYLCDFCTPSRQQVVKSFVSKT